MHLAWGIPANIIALWGYECHKSGDITETDTFLDGKMNKLMDCWTNTK